MEMIQDSQNKTIGNQQWLQPSEGDSSQTSHCVPLSYEPMFRLLALGLQCQSNTKVPQESNCISPPQLSIRPVFLQISLSRMVDWGRCCYFLFARVRAGRGWGLSFPVWWWQTHGAGSQTVLACWSGLVLSTLKSVNGWNNHFKMFSHILKCFIKKNVLLKKKQAVIIRFPCFLIPVLIRFNIFVLQKVHFLLKELFILLFLVRNSCAAFKRHCITAPASQEAEAGGSLESRILEPTCAI